MANISSRIIEALSKGGGKTLYVVPGASLNPLLDELYNQSDVRTVGALHEGAVAHGALADGMRNGLGVAVASQGAGFAELNKLSWLADANASPVLLLVGQSPSSKVGRDHAFQSVDTLKTSGYTKKVVRLEKNGNTAQTISDAIATASSGAPGAVVIEMPVDTLGAQDIHNGFILAKRPPVNLSSDGKRKITQVGSHIDDHNKRPLFILGDVFRAEAISNPKLQETLDAVSKKIGGAVGTTHGAADQWPTEAETSVGNFGYNLIASQADVFSQFNYPILLGAKPDDNLTLRSVGADWTSRPFVMVYPDKKVLAHYQKLYPEMIGIYSDIKPAIEQLGSFQYSVNPKDRLKHVSRAHAQMLDGMQSSLFKNGPDMRQVANAIVEATKEENVIHVFDAGDAASDVKQRIPYKGKDHIATASGHVGFAVPAGIGIANANSNQTNPPVVIIHSGDSGMHYTPAEIATAVQNKLPVVILSYNDGGYWAVNRCMKRDGFAATADSVADLPKVNFARVAEAYGARGKNILDMNDLASSIREAVANAKAGTPTVIDIPLARQPDIRTK